jgi:tRNA modification GTPase
MGGRMDLTQVEGLRDLIDAETEGQRKLALRVAGVGERTRHPQIFANPADKESTSQGAARERYEGIRRDIIHCLAMVEALIDFGEGEDIEEGVYEQGELLLAFRLAFEADSDICKARGRAKELQQIIQAHLTDGRRGEIMRSGIRLAIFGPPNAGKSSLLNFLGKFLLPGIIYRC